MRTTVQRVALIFGIVFLLVGVLGLITEGGMEMESDAMLLGMFHVNLLHNIVHLLFGVWGLLAARAWSSAKTYAQVGGVIYLVLAVLGLVAEDGFGLVPLGGNNVWLHAVLGIVLAGAGFTAGSPARDS